MKNLEEIEKNLNNLERDFHNQLDILGSDTKEFHNALIELTAKYPDHKELLQFIVFINDKLERNQTLYFDVISEAFTDSVKIKKEMIKEIMKTKEPYIVDSKKSFFSGITFKDTKVALISLAVISLGIWAMTSPDTLMAIIQKIGTIKW